MGADIVNQAMSMGSMIQMAMESLVSPTITAVTTALFTAMFVGRKTEQKGLAGTKTTIFEEEIRTLLDNGRLSYREWRILNPAKSTASSSRTCPGLVVITLRWESIWNRFFP